MIIRTDFKEYITSKGKDSEKRRGQRRLQIKRDAGWHTLKTCQKNNNTERQNPKKSMAGRRGRFVQEELVATRRRNRGTSSNPGNDKKIQRHVSHKQTKTQKVSTCFTHRRSKHSATLPANPFWATYSICVLSYIVVIEAVEKRLPFL